MTTATEVPFVDLGRSTAPLAAELSAAFEATASRGDFVLGEEVERFESEFGEYVGARCVGVASGTAALSLGLEALGIGAADEVIVPAHTFAASAFAVVHVGATQVFCDVDPATGLIDLDAAGAVAGPRTAAVMAVHLYGQTCDMDEVGSFAERHGIAVIEDAAQAHGARWGGRRAGSFGAVSAFSFYPSKNLGALGDGGAICCSKADVADRVLRLRNLGMRRKGEHLETGRNERLDTLQAAFLRVKLPHLDRWNAERRAAGERYRAGLPDTATALPSRDGAEDVFHLFPVRVRDRDELAAALGDAGIGTGVHYTPTVPAQPAFGRGEGEFPEAERWAAEELSLPMFAGITEDEVSRVCDAVAGQGEGGAR